MVMVICHRILEFSVANRFGLRGFSAGILVEGTVSAVLFNIDGRKECERGSTDKRTTKFPEMSLDVTKTKEYILVSPI